MHLLAVLDDVEGPIIAFTSQTVGGGALGDGSAVDRERERACKGTKAGIDDVGDAADGDREKHVLAHTCVARLEQDDTGGVPDGGEANRFQSGMHEAGVLEAIAAAMAGDDLGLQAFRVEAIGRRRRTSKLSNGMLAMCAPSMPTRVSYVGVRGPE